MSWLIDLHTHTTSSDGKLSPLELVKKASDLHLRAIAITDHDSVGGIKEGLSAGARYDVEVVPGIELSCYDNRGREYHILGYFIDWQDRKLLDYCVEVAESREERAREMVNALSNLGYKVSYTRVRSLASGTIGKPHIVEAVVGNSKNEQKLRHDFGKIPSVHEFVVRYLNPGKLAYSPKKGMSPKDAINEIRRLGGLSSLAHPGYTLKLDEDFRVKELVDWGLDAIEAIAPYGTVEKTSECIEHYSQLAKRLGILVTGGTDYHGREGVGTELGFGRGKFWVDYSILEFIKNKVEEIRAESIVR